MNNDLHEELERLVVTATLDALSDDERNRLDEILRNSPEARRVAAQMLIDEAAMVDELSTNEMADLFRAGNVSAPASDLVDWARRSDENTATQEKRSTISTSITASLLLVVAALSLYIFSHPGTKEQQGADQVQSTRVCGTLIHAKSCNWSTDLLPGEHLTADAYSLTKGTARILLTSGAELYCEAPAKFELVSPDHVVVSEGTVIADVGENAIGFRLETPTTNVIDLGTLFAVRVSKEGQTDVEVLEGAVSCLPAGRPTPESSPILGPGTASRFSTDQDKDGVEVESSSSSLQAIVNHARRQRTSNLLAGEDFENPTDLAGDSPNTNGWQGDWQLRRESSRPANIVIRSGRNLPLPNWLQQRTANFAVTPNNAMYGRRLAEPIDMSRDAEYFVSVVMRKKIVTAVIDQSSGAGFGLEKEGDHSVGVGISIDFRENLTVWSGQKQYMGTRNLPYDTCFLVVMKIQAHREEPDIVTVKAFDESSLPQVVEPDVWDVLGRPANIDGELEWFRIWSDASAVTMFDEIRIARTWEDAVPLR